jgi:hypothetical protein
MNIGSLLLTLIVGLGSNYVASFVWPSILPCFSCRHSSISASSLFSGVGIAKDYAWREEAFEIEVTVQVPPETRAKDISFKARTNSIELKLRKPEKKEEEEEDVLLLDPDRNLRGKVVIDGTYWVISDAEDDEGINKGRQVTVTIEKRIQQAKDDFDVIDYDWNGVYREEAEDEVSYRKYDAPEKLDVREYAASLGVDIDNINMSMVDKSMFSSGLNLTQKAIDGLSDSGHLQEVTQQGDGSEWITDDDGEQVPFSTMGKGVSQDEMRRSMSNNEGEEAKSPTIPFLDTDSPWNKAVPVEDTENVDTATEKQLQEKLNEKKKQLKTLRENQALDPIATLSVARLREILRSRNMKVSGNKKELQDRLRDEVNSMMDSTMGDANDTPDEA